MISPKIFFRFFDPESLVCDFPGDGKKLYLTFDDGPDPEVTSQVLQLLEQHRALATFFCIGDNAGKYPEVITAIREKSHAIGNHTFSHQDGWKTPVGEYIENAERCDRYFRTQLFRPPYGRFTIRQYLILRKKYRFILWSLLSGDYQHQLSPQQCLNRVLCYAKPGSIIVFHDSQKAKENLLFVLPRVLEHFRKDGYTFEKINS